MVEQWNNVPAGIMVNPHRNCYNTMIPAQLGFALANSWQTDATEIEVPGSCKATGSVVDG